MYDPVLGRFLSPDPLVSDPENTKNYNRYSYCMNNPLKYVDKNGLYPVPAQVLRNGKWVDVYVDSETREVMSDDEYQHWLEATGFDKDTKIQLDDEGNILIKGRVYSENDMFEFDKVEYLYTELQHADEDEFWEKYCDYINAKEKLQYLGSPLLSAASNGGGNGLVNVAKGALAFMSADVMVLDPTDAALTKWVGYAIAATTATIIVHHYAGKGNANYPGPWSYTVPDPTAPFYNPPKPPNFNPGDYGTIVKWAAGATLTARFLQQMYEAGNQPLYNTCPADATRVDKIPVIPIQPDVP